VHIKAGFKTGCFGFIAGKFVADQSAADGIFSCITKLGQDALGPVCLPSFSKYQISVAAGSEIGLGIEQIGRDDLK